MNEIEIDQIMKLAKLVHEDYQSLKQQMQKTRDEIQRQKNQLSKLYQLIR